MELFDLEDLAFDLDDDGNIEPIDLDVTDVVLDLIARHEHYAGHYEEQGFGDLADLHTRTAEFLKVLLEEPFDD